MASTMGGVSLDEPSMGDMHGSHGLHDLERDPAILDIEQRRHLNDMRLKGSFERIIAKYSRDFGDIGDQVDLQTGEVVVDNGHLICMRDETDTGSGGMRRRPDRAGDGPLAGEQSVADESEDELALCEGHARYTHPESSRKRRKIDPSPETIDSDSTLVDIDASITHSKPQLAMPTPSAAGLASATIGHGGVWPPQQSQAVELLGRNIASQIMHFFSSIYRPDENQGPSVWDSPVRAFPPVKFPHMASPLRPITASRTNQSVEREPSIWGTQKVQTLKRSSRAKTVDTEFASDSTEATLCSPLQSIPYLSSELSRKPFPANAKTRENSAHDHERAKDLSLEAKPGPNLAMVPLKKRAAKETGFRIHAENTKVHKSSQKAENYLGMASTTVERGPPPSKRKRSSSLLAASKAKIQATAQRSNVTDKSIPSDKATSMVCYQVGKRPPLRSQPQIHKTPNRAVVEIWSCRTSLTKSASTRQAESSADDIDPLVTAEIVLHGASLPSLTPDSRKCLKQTSRPCTPELRIINWQKQGEMLGSPASDDELSCIPSTIRKFKKGVTNNRTSSTRKQPISLG